ncbi:MAG: hypothetical protein RL095_1965 [Verrucomicrobiota bacterium]
MLRLSFATLFLLTLSSLGAATPEWIDLEARPLAAGNTRDTNGRISKVESPRLHLLRSPQKNAKGTVLVFPGGGYRILAADHEGDQVAAFCNRQGFDAAVLEYSVSAGPATRDLALAEAQKAWSLLRRENAALGLAGKRFGLIGFSAGGHLAARLSSRLDAAAQPQDLMLIYPAYLDETLPGSVLQALVPPRQPAGRLFTLIAANDRKEWMKSAEVYTKIWRGSDAYAEWHLPALGGHGFGLKAELPEGVKDWPERLAAFLQAPPPAAAANSAVAPVPQPGTQGRHAAKLKLVQQQKFDLVLLGDSITHNLENPAFKQVWDTHFAPRKALNLGTSGARTENNLWSLDQGLLDGQTPKVITLMIGTNNVDEKNYPVRHSAGQLVEGTAAIVARLRQKCPQAKILLIKPFPGSYDGPVPTSHRIILERAGAGLAKLADGQQVFLADFNHLFLKPDGAIDRELMPDCLHPSPKGAGLWAQAMEPLLSRLMGDQIRGEPPANSALVPAPKLEEDCYDWHARHAEILKIKNAVNPDIVMIGDSITHFWGGLPKSRTHGPKSWEELFGQRRVLNLGFGWDRIQNMLWRLDAGELDGLSPRLVVINAGTNNSSQTRKARANTPAEIAAGVAALVIRVRSKCPQARILVTGILPREELASHPRRQLLDAANLEIEAWTKQHGVDFLRLNERFLDAAGQLSRELCGDLCHPSEKGYRIWAEGLQPYLPPRD